MPNCSWPNSASFSRLEGVKLAHVSPARPAVTASK
jgi:hypothetical protein